MKSGDNGEEDPPVPIPNTEVKLFSAEDTWRETAWENRSLPVLREKQFTKVDCFFCEREARVSKTGQHSEGNVTSIFKKRDHFIRFVWSV